MQERPILSILARMSLGHLLVGVGNKRVRIGLRKDRDGFGTSRWRCPV